MLSGCIIARSARVAPEKDTTSGFTLLEVLIAMAVLSVSLLAVFTALSGGARNAAVAVDQYSLSETIASALDGLREGSDGSTPVAGDLVVAERPDLVRLLGAGRLRGVELNLHFTGAVGTAPVDVRTLAITPE